jgi:GntR family transcriptional regulator, carbon starvation induced regulator
VRSSRRAEPATYDAGRDARSRMTARSTGRISRATLTTQLEEALRTDIVAGLLEPGRKLRAADVASLYGVSPTPVREAVQRLSAEGLVELDPKIGVRVASISPDDVRDVFAVRLILETRAVEMSITNGGASWLADVSAAFERLNAVVSARLPRDGAPSRETMLEWAEAHRAFHWALLAACGSPWLLRFISVLHGHSARYRMLLVGGRDRPAWLRGHAEILQAARRRDARRAATVLERHTSDALTTLIRSYVASTQLNGSGAAPVGTRKAGPRSGRPHKRTRRIASRRS